MCKIACTSPCFCNTDPGAPTIKQRPKTALMASIVFSRRYFAHLFQFWFSSKCRKSASVTKAQFRELRNCFKDIKLNLTASRPHQYSEHPHQMATAEMLKYWLEKSNSKLFISIYLATVEQKSLHKIFQTPRFETGSDPSGARPRHCTWSVPF